MSEIIVLHVPYNKKDEAKKVGARWDIINKTWYIKKEQMSPYFKQYLPENWYKVYLNLPYEMKEEAKEHGAQWDNNEKKWFFYKKDMTEEYEEYRATEYDNNL
jgi:hypothetical protein